MTTPEALVEPALLIWARKTSGLQPEVAARKMAIKPERLLAWEAGTEHPTIAQLRRAAAVYKRPLAVFLLPEPPTTFEAMRDFRRTTPSQGRELSPELTYAIRRAWEKREAATDLSKESDDAPSPVALHTSQDADPETLGTQIRAWLGVGVSTQYSWGSEWKALSAWKLALERQFVLVFQMRGVESTEARGFSIAADILPVIAVNSRDTPTGRTFTLLHEVAHIVLRRSGICDLQEATGADIEVFCNAAAAAALVPADALLHEPGVALRTHTSSWTDGDLKRIATRFCVSREVVLRRLVTIGKASAAFYSRKRQQFEDQYRRLLQASRNKDSSGPIPQHVLALSANGTLFTHIVLSAYHRGSITLNDASDYLGVRPRHIEALATEAYMKAG